MGNYLKGISTTDEEKDSEASSLGQTYEKYKYELLSRQIKDDFRRQQVETNKKNNEFQDKFLENFKKSYKEDIDKKTRDLEDKIENSKLSIIETLGMFVALFTFISVDFQIFKSYTNPALVGALTAIMVGSIFLFIIVFDFFILQARKIRKTGEGGDPEVFTEDTSASKARKFLICLSALFIFGGLAVFFVINPQEIYGDKEQIKKEILTTMQSDLSSQKSELEKINENNGSIIKKTNEDIAKFKKCIRDFGFSQKCFED